MKNATPQPGDEPPAEYVRRLDAWKTRQALYESRHHSLGNAKLALGGACLVVVALALAAKVISVLWVLAPLLAIIVLAVIHERVLDSLQGGISRFYAEIKRLKQITDLTRGPLAVLFLLDEYAYPEFKRRVDAFRDFYGLTSFTYKQLDKVLWSLGDTLLSRGKA